MTTRTRRPHYQCIRAFADGWPIESVLDGMWASDSQPTFHPDRPHRIVPDADGWLPWFGSEDGKGPFEGNPMVEYVCVASGYNQPCPQDKLRWDHVQSGGDIILYRLHKEAAPAEPKWRVGRKVARTIYEGDCLVGLMDTPELARMVVDALNKMETA